MKMLSRQDTISADLCKALLSADIPLNKLDNPELKGFLEKVLRFSLPTQSLFRKKHLPNCYNEVMQQIKEGLGNHPVWVSTDCSRDSMGREVANVFVGQLDSQRYHAPFLVNVEFLEKADSASTAR